MKFVCRVKVRKDLTCYLACFEIGAVLIELQEPAAFVTELLAEDRTREELVGLFHQQFPELDAEKGIDYILQTFGRMGLLEGMPSAA